MNIRGWIAAFFPLCLLLANCGGVGDETTNGMVMGSVKDQTGAYAADVQVKLYPVNYDPVKQGALVPVDTTDNTGSYVFTRNNPGYYNVQAVHLYNRSRALVSGIYVVGEKVIAPVATLLNPGTIKVMLPDSVDTVNGYLYIPGTGIFADLAGASDSVIIDSVPAGMVSGIYYSIRGGTGYTVLRYNILVPSGDTVVVANPTWRFSRRLYLNTTMTGAGVSGDVVNFPVLIRLTGSNFVFSQAQRYGEDVRFLKTDNTPLSYEIERWDSANGAAEIWAMVDTVYGSDSSQYIQMLWGRDNVGSESNGAAVFDTGNGFQGVWHLGEAGNTTAKDATPNHYDGTPTGMSAASAASGAIGISRVFDGASSYLRMQGTANSRLNFPENGVYSLSTWVNADSIDGLPHVIAGKGHEDYYLKFVSNIITKNQWEFVEYHDKTGWQITDDTIQATAKTWEYLVGIRNGTKQYLYCDGVLIDSTIRATVCDSVRVETDDFSIGRYLRFVTFLNPEGMCTFSGKIDEVRVSSFAPNADWIRLSYMNQRLDDKLIMRK
jgi:hypothetical protein